MIRNILVVAAVLFSALVQRSAFSDELTASDAKRAVDRYLAEVEEIDRVAAMRKAAAKARLEQTLRQLKRFAAETKSGNRYRGMLGSYYSHQGRIPFIMLSVPDGTNVISQRSRRIFNEHLAGGTRLYKFEAEGHVVIPRDGSYRLEVSRAAGVKLNDIEYAVGSPVAGQPPYADVQLKRGVYRVTYDVGNNGGQMNYAKIRILDNDSGEELPIFVYESDLEEFRRDLSLGVELRETSGWKAEEFRLR